MSGQSNATGTSAAITKASESAAIVVSPGTVKRYINQLATDQEVALFINQCVMFGLNPFKREIYLIKYSTKDPATFVVGYEVYLKRAERTRNWAGMNSGVTFNESGQLVSAWVDVYRKDWPNPLHHEVYLQEYIQTKDEWVNGQRTGKKIPTKFWAEKPITMLKKVAIAQAFRMAFPDEMGGMPYTAEEMPIEHAKLPTAEVIIEAQATQADPASRVQSPPNVKDEFSGDAPPAGDDPLDQAYHGKEEAPATSSPKASPDQVQAIMDGVAKLVALNVAESMVWGGIGKKLRENFEGFQHLDEPSDLTPEQAKFVVTYLHKWEKAANQGGKK